MTWLIASVACALGFVGGFRLCVALQHLVDDERDVEGQRGDAPHGRGRLGETWNEADLAHHYRQQATKEMRQQ